MASLFAQPYFTGTPLGRLEFYRSGTLTPAAVYADDTGEAAMTVVTADTAGRFPAIYLDEETVYRVIEKRASGEIVADVEGVTATGGGGIRSAGTVNTLALLTAIDKASLTGGQIATVNGYNVPGDGGGGFFQWDAASSAATVLGDVVAADEGGSGRWRRLDAGPAAARWFGARGDNTTADTAAINAAISQAATRETITFGEGSFLTAGGHVVPGSKILSFVGQVNGSIIKATGVSTLLTFVTDPDFIPGFRKLEGLTFDGNGPDEFNPRTGSLGIKIGGGGTTSASIIHPVIRDCYFRRFGLGAWHYSSQQSLVEATMFYRCDTGALYQTDDEHGGSTALTERKTVYQFCTTGMVVDKKAAFALATTATLGNSSTGLTSVASTAGVTTGMAVTGPGIRVGTTVAAVGASTITLSQATTGTAAGSLVPILIRNTTSAVGGFPLYETDGPVFEGALFQGNFLNGLALYSQDRVHLRDCYFERNCSGAATSATVLNSARVVPKVPLYIFNSTVKITGGVFSEPLPSVTIRAEAGSVVRMEDVTCGDTPDFITGDLTSAVEFYGTLRDATGRITVPVGRWPDNIFLAKGISAVGNPFQVRSLAVPNTFTGNARMPAFNIDAGAITATIEQEATQGPVRAYAFPAVTGAIGVNSISAPIGTVTNGDQRLISLLIRSDTYTNITASVTDGNYAQASLPVGPVWRRLVICFRAESTNSGVNLFLFPTAADGPKIQVLNMMQVAVPAGADTAPISTVLREGLFNDGTLDGALRGTATIDLGSIASGANGAAQTITVPGAAVGMRAVVQASIDTQGVNLGARVSAANTVTFIPSNPTGGAIDLASATYTAFVTP